MNAFLRWPGCIGQLRLGGGQIQLRNSGNRARISIDPCVNEQTGAILTFNLSSHILTDLNTLASAIV